MSTTWTIVLVVGVGTIAIKALGPLLLGGRPLPPRANSMITLLAPALLAALVAINTLGGDRQLVIDARLPGVLAAAVAIKLKAPVLVVIVVAAVVTAGVRAVAG
jgi:branched chain amino acid efflux pump